MKEKANEQAKGRLWTRDYILVIFISLFSSFSFNMISSLLTKYLVSVGIAVSVAGVIVGLFSITALIVRPVAGNLSDSYNKKMLAVISTFAMGLCMLGYTLSTALPFLVIFRIVHAITYGISGTSLAALIVDYIPDDRMGEGIGYFGFGQILATAVAPGIGLSISDLLGMRFAFYAACILAVAGALLLLVTPLKRVPHIKPEKKKKFGLDSIVSKSAVNVTIIGSIFSYISGSVSAFIVVLAEQVNVSGISVFFTVSAIVMLLVRPFSGKIFDQKGLAVLLYPSFVIGILGMVLMGRSVTLWMFLVAAVFRAVSQGVAFPSLQAEAIRKTPRDRAGLANSTYMIGMDLGNGVGPIVGGVIAEYSGYQMVYYFCAVLMAIGFVWYFVYDRKEKKLANQAGER